MNTPEMKAMMHRANQMDKESKKEIQKKPTTSPIPEITKAKDTYFGRNHIWGQRI